MKGSKLRIIPKLSFIRAETIPRPSRTPSAPFNDEFNLSLYLYRSDRQLSDIVTMPVRTEMPTPFPVSKPACKQASAIGSDVDSDALLDPEAILLLLSSEEKIRLLSGDDMWHTVPVPRLSIPRVRVSLCDCPLPTPANESQMSDGPNGVRGTACKSDYIYFRY